MERPTLSGADADIGEVEDLPETSGGVDDATRASAVDDTSDGSAPVSLATTDAVENQPADLVLENEVTSLPEDTDTTNSVKVADIVIIDDGVGNNSLYLTGFDPQSFSIIGDALYLKAGTVVDYETKPWFDVTIRMDDPTVGFAIDDSYRLSITITDVDENQPPELRLENTGH